MYIPSVTQCSYCRKSFDDGDPKRFISTEFNLIKITSIVCLKCFKNKDFLWNMNRINEANESGECSFKRFKKS